MFSLSKWQINLMWQKKCPIFIARSLVFYTFLRWSALTGHSSLCLEEVNLLEFKAQDPCKVENLLDEPQLIVLQL